MNRKQEALIKSVLGDSLYESLTKAIVKKDTKSVVDIGEMASALKIVPKSVVAFLMKEAKPMADNEAKKVKLPFAENAEILLNKMSEDVYKGHIEEDGKVVHEFDLCSIPQLSAHLLSHFELYDEPVRGEESKEETPKEESKKESSDMSDRVKALEDKIDQLFMLAVQQKSQPQVIIQTKEASAVEKNEPVSPIAKVLKKAGMMPKMATPPRAGTKVGGMQGITKEGLHGDKTEHSDLNTKPRTMIQNKDMKISDHAKTMFKQPKQPKLGASTQKSEKQQVLTVKKNEIVNKCSNCEQDALSCACFKALSKPDIKKSESTITLKFNNDWSKEAVYALYKSVSRRK